MSRRRSPSTASQPRVQPALEKITFGVYVRGQHTWTLELLASSTLKQLAETLCDHAVRELRPRDCNVDAHMWTFIIGSAEVNGRTKWATRGRYTSCFHDFSDDGDRSPATRLRSLQLSNRSRLRFEYDMGDTAQVAMKVLNAGEPTRSEGLPRWMPATSQANEVLRGSEEWRRLMASVPAHSASARIDSAYPRLAKLILRMSNEADAGAEWDDDGEGGEERAPAADFLLGLSAMETRADDATFLAVGTSDCDLLHAPVAFASVEELLKTADDALAPDPSLRPYRAGWTSHLLFPAAMEPEAEETYNRLRADVGREGLGPVQRVHRMGAAAAESLGGGGSGGSAAAPVSRRRRGTTVSTSAFSFAQAFPRTNEQLTSGRFRWFKYEPARRALTVCVGRGGGVDRRTPQHICRAWKAQFDSLHELLCAVEASWVHPDRRQVELGSTALDVIDEDNGPRCPLPPPPPRLAGPGSATTLRIPTERARVTAMLFAACRRSAPARVWHAAFVNEPAVITADDALSVLFVGTAGGHLERWALEPASLAWRKLRAHAERAPEDAEAIYMEAELSDEEAEDRDDDDGASPGLPVIGLLLADDSAAGTTRLFSWSHEHRIKVWKARSGACVDEFEAVVGGGFFSAGWAVAINCVVLVRQPDGARVLLAGLHCAGDAPNWVASGRDEPPEDADEESDDDCGELGNLLPLDPSSGEALEAWVGHETPVVALATTASGYVASCGSAFCATNLLLWSTEGVLLRQIVFNNLRDRPDPLSESHRRVPPLMHDVNGMAAHGNTLLLMVDYGAALLAVDLESEAVRGKLRVGLHPGYEGGGFHCCLASTANLAAGANGEDHEGAGGWGARDPTDVHGTALLIDMRTVLGSAVLVTAEGEGEEQEEHGDDSDERDFGEECAERGRADRHRGVGIGVVATALRHDAGESTMHGGLAQMDEDRGNMAATLLAISPGWLATGYDDGTVRLQHLPGHLTWSHEPGTSASALRDGAGHCDRCNWHLPEEDGESDDDSES